MIIPLPDKFEYNHDAIHAYEEEGILKMTPYGFEEIMYAITYELNGDQFCHYCHRSLTRSIRTLDHIYPRAYGGVSIPNNLVVCCKECNSTKSNLLPEQYSKLRKEEDATARKRWMEYYTDKNLERRRQTGIILPSKWYEMRENYMVFTPITSSDNFKTSQKYQTLLEKYETYGKICRPIVISRNRVVIDGFLALILAKNLGLKIPLPFIMLENVEVIM